MKTDSEREILIHEYSRYDKSDLCAWLVDTKTLLEETEYKLSRAQDIDPDRLESALRLYLAELDYDLHKSIADPEDGGPDRYPEEVEFFLRCWDIAGEG